ncbi:MAG: DUF2844 domain-containing protein [Massilia sp.]
MRRLLKPSLLLPLLSLCLPLTGAHAALGAAPSNVGAATPPSQARVLAASGRGSTFTVRASTLDSGTAVREYVNSDGIVFAVSWSGPLMPDLRTLLGAHFTTFASESAKRPRAGHSAVSIQRPELVVVSGGHMRAFKGYAYTTAGLPEGFTAADIQ